ncbi:MAG: hypothetical protein ACP5P9_05895 [Acidimicrobiales bacterium]
MMQTMGRDDVERGQHGHGRGCCGGGGGGCCGGRGHGRHLEHQDETASRRRLLEERRRDLEEALAEVTSELSGLGAERR